MDALGYLYREGKGVPQDYVEAMKWFRKGADAGDGLAMRNVGCTSTPNSG
jgi:TPR repeat protein